MKLTKLSLAMVGCASMVAGVAHAGGPTVSDVLGNSGITESGYIDAAYTSVSAVPGANGLGAPAIFNANSNGTINPFSGGNASTFNVQQAGIQLAKQPASGFGGLIDITMGSDANVIKSYPESGGSGFDLTQAFVQYANGAWTIMGGKYSTLASAEVIAPTGNTNITRSIEFFQVPFTHTGVRVAYAPLSTLTLYAGVNNGWDQEQDSNKAKTVELGVAWNPSSMVSLAVQGYSGAEYSTTDVANPNLQNALVQSGLANAQGTRQLIDAVLTVKPTSSLSLILNVDSGKQEKGAVDFSTGNIKDASWSAIVGYVNYQWTDKWRTSLRAEEFKDNDGYKLGMYDGYDTNTGDAIVNKSIKEVTLTAGYAPDPSFEIRAEVRQDKADKKVFADVSGGNPTDNVTTLALEGLYKF